MVERAWLVYRAGFGAGIYLALTTLALSLIHRVGVGPLTLALVGTTLEVAYFLAEVPTGVVADRRGRKPSVVIGLVAVGAGLALSAAPWLWVVLAGQVLLGAGWTFTSGADIAWLTDEVGEEAARPLYASGARAELLGSIAGLALGAGLGVVALWLPLVAGGAALVAVAGWLAARMPEDPARRGGAGDLLDQRPTLVETLQRLRRSVRARPAVGVLLVVMVAFGFAGEGVDRLWQFHLVGEEAGERSTVVVVAALLAVGLATGAALTTVVERRLEVDDDGAHARRWVAVANVGVGVSVLVLAVAPWWVAAAGFVVSESLRHAAYPMVQAWANRDADPATRATLNSLVTQAESVGELGGGPALGGMASAWSTRLALGGAAAVFAVAAALSTRRGGEPR